MEYKLMRYPLLSSGEESPCKVPYIAFLQEHWKTDLLITVVVELSQLGGGGKAPLDTTTF